MSDKVAMRARVAACIAIVAVQAGCEPPVVAWSDGTTRVALVSPDGRLDVDPGGTLATSTPRPVPDPQGSCPGSVKTASRGALIFAGWWSAAAAGNAHVRFSRSNDGGATWSAPVTVDARDGGARGCRRPALSISVGEGSDYLHIVYWMEPADGAGVFFTHSMDAGGMFHAPVAVGYGGGQVRADVASVGDTVVVAHEDPNSPTPRLLVAVSRTAGHIFEQHFPVPSEGTPQRDPRVALEGNRLFVGWLDPGGLALVVRSGILRTTP